MIITSHSMARSQRLGVCAFVVTLISCAVTAQAQFCEWVNRTTPGPSGRYEHAMAYDSRRHVTVLFGGTESFVRFGDTWEYNGLEWNLRATSGPTPRRAHAMAYDSTRGVVVLFGGRDDGGWRNDTWEWNGVVWRQVADTGPSPRAAHAMVYDAARAVVVLFGGSFDFHSVGETWEWDGATWRQVSNTGPSARSGHAMAYDSHRSVTVLFGGNASASHRDDLWEWDGIAWRLVSTGGPEARYSHAIAFDEQRGAILLFGGVGRYTGVQRDTWVWVDSVWTRVWVPPPAETPRYSHTMVFDAARRCTVLFGGVPNFLADTWHFECRSIRLLTEATCPGGGPIRVGWLNATPRGRVALLFGPRAGQTRIPPGIPCEGTVLSLGGPLQLAAITSSDGQGRGLLSGSVGSAVCGGRLQLLDEMVCATSNVVRIE